MGETNSALWVKCPRCGNATKTKVYPETVLINYPLYCCECDQEFKVNVVQLKMVVSDEQEK